MIQQIGLIVASSIVLACAVPTVVSRNLVHSVFWLAATLISMSLVFVFLGAPFLAGIQIVLYTGGVTTLMLFGVMLTQRESGTLIPNPVDRRLPAAGTAVAALGVILWAIWGTPELATRVPIKTQVATIDLGQLFLSDQLLAFEALSVLLLAAMIGAIVLVRKTDP
ncbi:MAG: NADH-quinone oxidoreductase subunit J [Kiritimatiellia bacterium]|jgi:NADH-quinone oxidoreductase subunit J